jgi:DNA-binding response OmpR family regulator
MTEPGLTGKILLLGLDDPSMVALCAILADQSHSVSAEPFPSPEQSSSEAITDAEVVCCPAELRQYNAVVRSMREKGSSAPVVVVSSSTDVHEWLDAIEAGAWDYVSAPFEPKHIQNVLENALRCAASG